MLFWGLISHTLHGCQPQGWILLGWEGAPSAQASSLQPDPSVLVSDRCVGPGCLVPQMQHGSQCVVL